MRAAQLAPPVEPGRGATRLLAWVAVALIGAATVAGVEHLRNTAPVPLEVPRMDPDGLVAGYGPSSYPDAVAAADSAIADKRAILALGPGEWLRMEGLGRAFLARGRLTANPEDLLEANRLLARAVAAAPWPAGPVLSRAGAALVVHDLPAAEQALARFDAGVAGPSALEAEEARGMRCEIAFERGAMARARELCGAGGGLGLALRRANMALAGGDAKGAARIVEHALEQPGHSPPQLSAMMLQRAAIALATGDWSASGQWARAANRVFPGHWLAEAMVAQQLALEGRVRDAEAAYRAVAERTDNADIWSALARLTGERGDEAAMRGYLAKAGASWERRIALLPDTYAGHYAEHLAQTGAIERALAISGGDFAQRPYLPVITGYAIVLNQAGRHREVLAVVERGEAAGFRSPTLLMFKSGALAALGRTREAEQARKAALAMNPKIEHPNQAFVHFRQD